MSELDDNKRLVKVVDNERVYPEWHKQPTPESPAPDAGPVRFRVILHEYGYYRVSIPSYGGGEVVAASDYDHLAALVPGLVAALTGLKQRHGCWCELPPNAGSPDHTIECEQAQHAINAVSQGRVSGSRS